MDIPDRSISRRRFVRRAVERAAVAAASMPAIARAHASLVSSLSVVGWRAGPDVRVGVVDLPAAPTDPRAMGLILGAEEAMHAASLFGGKLELVALPSGALGSAGLSAIVGNGDCARCSSVGGAANAAGIPFVNIGCAADELRGAGCQRTMFHIAPSDAMCRDALAAAHATGTAVAWHPSLTRFGADTLNRRFQERFSHAMTADAWTAWLSTKILWESALRMQSAAPGKLIDYLTRDTTQFDGHKGLPLSFRLWDHQLRQPLYVVNGSSVTEMPKSTNSDDAPRDILDQLGTRAAASACHVGS